MLQQLINTKKHLLLFKFTSADNYYFFKNYALIFKTQKANLYILCEINKILSTRSIKVIHLFL